MEKWCNGYHYFTTSLHRARTLGSTQVQVLLAVWFVVMSASGNGPSCIWNKAFKNGPSKTCGRQPLKKKLKGYGVLQADQTPSNFLETVFHKFYLVHSWILCPVYGLVHFRRTTIQISVVLVSFVISENIVHLIVLVFLSVTLRMKLRTGLCLVFNKYNTKLSSL